MRPQWVHPSHGRWALWPRSPWSRPPPSRRRKRARGAPAALGRAEQLGCAAALTNESGVVVHTDALARVAEAQVAYDDEWIFNGDEAEECPPP